MCMLFSSLYFCVLEHLRYSLRAYITVYFVMFSLVSGVLYPAYASFKAVKTRNMRSYVRFRISFYHISLCKLQYFPVLPAPHMHCACNT